MTADRWVTVAVAAGIAGYLAYGLLALRLKSPPETLMKTNVAGRRVPAVMGGPLVLASLMTLALVAIAGVLGWTDARPTRVMSATAIVTAVMALAGSWDDRRGDERARGFKGHLGAARTGALTGGLVKIGAAVVAGLAATAVLTVDDVITEMGPASALVLLVAVVKVVGLVALTANLVNLADRAPGRAAKVTLVMAIPLVLFGDPAWAIAAAPLVGALLGVFGADLKERAMLGDAGANPLGAVVGLGLAASLEIYPAVVAITLLLALNLASEKWSFSAVIERTPILRWLDSLGRLRAGGDETTVRETTAGE